MQVESTMAEPDLSFIKSDIDLSEVAPLNRRRVVAIVNCYLLKMTDFLNAFANRAERLILETERKLRAVDIKLQLLEAKLSAIPDPASIHVKQQVESKNEVNKSDPCESIRNSELTAKETGSKQSSHVVRYLQEVPENAGETEQPSASVKEGLAIGEQNTLLIKDDPAFAKYFRMLKLGVLEAAVKQKMQSEGVDPNLLDNPNAVSPSLTGAPIQTDADISQVDDSDSSTASFTDSD